MAQNVIWYWKWIIYLFAKQPTNSRFEFLVCKNKERRWVGETTRNPGCEYLACIPRYDKILIVLLHVSVMHKSELGCGPGPSTGDNFVFIIIHMDVSYPSTCSFAARNCTRLLSAFIRIVTGYYLLLIVCKNILLVLECISFFNAFSTILLKFIDFHIQIFLNKNFINFTTHFISQS